MIKRFFVPISACFLLFPVVRSNAGIPFTVDSLPSSRPERVYTGIPGPWGQLQYTRIAIVPHAQYIETVTTATFETGTWVFRNGTKERVAELFGQAELTPKQRDYIMNRAKWVNGPGAVVVHPDAEFILGMSPAARQLIYSILELFEENGPQMMGYEFHAETIDDHFYRSGVSEETIARFKTLLYPKNGVLFFADFDPFLASLPTAEEKRNFHTAMARKITLLVKLHITPETDIEVLADYWDNSSRPKDLRPLLESLARVPGGTYIDIAHLLPGFARKRIYTFPRPNDSNPIDHNCHWTAFNFYNDPSDERFCDVKFIQKTVAEEYDPVTTDMRFGDIVVLFDAKGDAVHSSVWLAEGLVFTKNGSGNGEPFLYMHLKDMLKYYMAVGSSKEQFHIQVFRKKSLNKPEI